VLVPHDSLRPLNDVDSRICDMNCCPLITCLVCVSMIYMGNKVAALYTLYLF